MQRLEVRCAVRPLLGSFGFKGLMISYIANNDDESTTVDRRDLLLLGNSTIIVIKNFYFLYHRYIGCLSCDQ